MIRLFLIMIKALDLKKDVYWNDNKYCDKTSWYAMFHNKSLGGDFLIPQKSLRKQTNKVHNARVLCFVLV